MNKIYVLEGSQGQYSDYSAWVEGIFTSIEHAIEYCDNTWEGIEIQYGTPSETGTYEVYFTVRVQTEDDYDPRWYHLTKHLVDPKRGTPNREF